MNCSAPRASRRRAGKARRGRGGTQPMSNTAGADGSAPECAIDFDQPPKHLAVPLTAQTPQERFFALPENFRPPGTFSRYMGTRHDNGSEAMTSTRGRSVHALELAVMLALGFVIHAGSTLVDNGMI